MKFQTIDNLIAQPGLRIVIVKDYPSPWSQAARTIFEQKGLEYVVGSQVAGEANEQLVSWSGQNSGPVVAYADEFPVHRWLDILLLAERLGPQPSLLPVDPEERIRMVGLTHELSGDNGIGWWCRIAMFAPAMSMDDPPAPLISMARKWGYSKERSVKAPTEVATRLRFLGGQLEMQRAQGSRFLVGERLSALDIHWAAMSVLFQPLAPTVMPLLPGTEGLFSICKSIPEISDAMDPELFGHRDFIVDQYFRTPFDYNDS